MAKLIGFGDILLIVLPTHAPRGHEQEGVRPAVVVGLPERAGGTTLSDCFGDSINHTGRNIVEEDGKGDANLFISPF